MPDESTITIVDVATRAGVSVSTVSRIINERPDVAAATRARVLQVIEELGFRPHAQARRLAGGKGHTIAVLYPLDRPGEDLINQLQLDFALGAAAGASEAGYFCNLLTNPVTADSLLGLYRGGHVDGLILMEVHVDDWRVELLRAQGHPFTMIGRSDRGEGIDFVDLDVEAAVLAMFDHLAGLGHREIGFLTYAGRFRERGFGPAVRAWSGYQRSLAAHGLAGRQRETSFMAAEMVEATHALLDETPGISAFVSLTDSATGAVLQALADRGLRVPHDVSVIGLATDHMAEILTPPLTAVRFPAYDMGYHAATTLIRRLAADHGPPDQLVVAPELVLRGTTARAAGGGPATAVAPATAPAAAAMTGADTKATAVRATSTPRVEEPPHGV